jgi:hypothetical protein
VQAPAATVALEVETKTQGQPAQTTEARVVGTKERAEKTVLKMETQTLMRTMQKPRRKAGMLK